MKSKFKKSQLAIAVISALGTMAIAVVPNTAMAAKTAGTYVTGDFHNHNTCNDGSTSIQNVIQKSTDRAGKPWNGSAAETPWGLDWFVQAGHGNSGGTQNCTLTEDATLGTDLYPYDATVTPTTTWSSSLGTATNVIKGDLSSGNPYMWRWQSVTEYEYPLLEYLDARKGLPLWLGMEENPWGHEHASAAVLTGQMPTSLDSKTLPTTPGAIAATTNAVTGAVTFGRYTPDGNAELMAQHTYCFDRTLTDTSRGNIRGTAVGHNYDCTNPNSGDSGSTTTIASGAGPTSAWNNTAKKLMPASGTNNGVAGHAVTVEGVKWMKVFAPDLSYFVPAHLERAGPFAPNQSAGYNVESLRDFNNAAPRVAFGMETQPGHGASSERGEYYPHRNNITGMSSPVAYDANNNALTGTDTKTDSVGGTTWGGTGIYGAWVGGVWDALLGEGRNFWFFASSDWHNRGVFGRNDRRSTQDFYPGEYQRNFTMVRTGTDKIRAQTVVDGLRTGNNWAASGQLIDRLAFVACASYAGIANRTNASVETLALNAAKSNKDTDVAGCSAMGEKLQVRSGADIVVAVVVRDPAGRNYAPYSFNNQSLAQVSVSQPINEPVLDHVDVVRGLVTGYKTPGAADYSGQWPNDWLANEVKVEIGTKTLAELMATVPAAAKNTSAAVIKTFNNGTGGWTAKDGYLVMSYRIPAVQASQYVRLRGTNLPAGVPYETDANGNPLPDVYTNATLTVKDGGLSTAAVGSLRIECKVTGSNVPLNSATYTQAQVDANPIDGCPNHLPTVNGKKYVAYDVAAWSDLWFYSNPIYVQVTGGQTVAGVQ